MASPTQSTKRAVVGCAASGASPVDGVGWGDERRGDAGGKQRHPLSLMPVPVMFRTKKEGYMLERRGLVGGHASHPRRGKLRPSPSHAAKNKKEHSQTTQDGHTRAIQECDRQPARGTTLTTYPPTHQPNRPTTHCPPSPPNTTTIRTVIQTGHHRTTPWGTRTVHPHRHTRAQTPPSSPPQAPPPPRPTAAQSAALTAASPPLPAP